MRLRNLLSHIRDKALAIKNINSFSTNDVYETYNKTDIRYSNLSFCPVNAVREDNVMRYEFMVYYADRLLVFDHESNKNEIYETGVDIIMSLLNSLDDDIMYDIPLQFTYFEQQFSDYLAGVYAQVTLEVPYEQGNCELISEIPPELDITENGVYDVTEYAYINVNVDLTDKIHETESEISSLDEDILETSKSLSEIKTQLEEFYGNY